MMAFVAAMRESLGPLLARPRAFSTVQTVEFLAAAPKIINHRLTLKPGKTPLGWLVSDVNAAVTIHRTAWDDSTVTLEASGDVTAQIEVW